MSNTKFFLAVVLIAAVIGCQISEMASKASQTKAVRQNSPQAAEPKVVEKSHVSAVKSIVSPKIEKLKIAETPKPEAVKMEVAKPATQIVKMKVTAYCLCSECCGKWSGGNKTSTGDKATVYDGVAADPKLLPYRTQLNIPGIGIKEVDDTGGGMRQSAKQGIYHIDVRMPSHSEARKWGVRWLEVEVLGNPFGATRGK